MAEGLGEALPPLAEGEAPAEAVPGGALPELLGAATEGEALVLIVVEVVSVGEKVPVKVSTEKAPVTVAEALLEALGASEGEPDGEGEGEASPLAETAPLPERASEMLQVPVGLTVGRRVALPEPPAPAPLLREGDCVGLGEVRGEAQGVALALAQPLTVPLSEPLPESLAEGEAEAERQSEAVAEGDSRLLGDLECVPLPLREGVGVDDRLREIVELRERVTVGLADRERVSETVAEEQPETLALPVSVTLREGLPVVEAQ